MAYFYTKKNLNVLNANIAASRIRNFDLCFYVYALFINKTQFNEHLLFNGVQ